MIHNSTTFNLSFKITEENIPSVVSYVDIIKANSLLYNKCLLVSSYQSEEISNKKKYYTITILCVFLTMDECIFFLQQLSSAIHELFRVILQYHSNLQIISCNLYSHIKGISYFNREKDKINSTLQSEIITQFIDMIQTHIQTDDLQTI